MNQLPKKHTSPTNLQKLQEKTLNLQAQQLLQQIPAKNLRNPDAFVTSILKNPTNLTGSQGFPANVGKTTDVNAFRKEFEAGLLEHLKNAGNQLSPEAYQAEVEKFQRNYEEFYRGYTPDVNSFRKYDEIKKNLNKPAENANNLGSLAKDKEFQANMKRFFGDESKDSKEFAVNLQPKEVKPVSPSKKETEIVKGLQNSKYNPITGKYY